MNVGIIGAGPWGRNHVRVYKEIGLNLKLVADVNEVSLRKVNDTFGVKTTTDYKEILNDNEIQAVSICVPASLHYKIAKEALEAGKNVLVEKPLAMTSKDGEELIAIANEKNLKLAVGHVFRFDPTIKRIKEEITKDTFGKIYYLSLARMGLKKPREDVGAILNYAVHDFDIMCDILGEEYPTEISAVTTKCLGREFEDLAIIAAKFKNGTIGHTQVSWLIPRKIRDFWLVGEKKSASINTMDFEIEIFDAGIIPQYQDFGTFKLITKEGDSYKPFIKKNEPLKAEILHFIDCIKNNKELINSAEVGLRAVKMSEAALESAKQCKAIKLDENGNI